jgi:hypothetical protein
MSTKGMACKTAYRTVLPTKDRYDYAVAFGLAAWRALRTLESTK